MCLLLCLLRMNLSTFADDVMQSSADCGISTVSLAVSTFLELCILVVSSMASPVVYSATQQLLLLSRSLQRQLARTTKESKEWEQQTWELSDAVLRNSDIQADMAKTLKDTRACHAAEMAAARERAVMREEVRTALPAVAFQLHRMLYL